MENNDHMRPPKIPYELLRKITNDFSEERIIGNGSFGVVYKGVQENGGDIAVKVLKMTRFDDSQFEKEFQIIVKLKHQNVVQLMGFCNESVEEVVEHGGKYVRAEKIHTALCFEYLDNGDLGKYISDQNQGLNWQTRYKIIKGTCEGLKYLRGGLERPVYHLDLKPENILLDKEMNPKIADFGLSRLVLDERTRQTLTSLGTCGYWPPEYIKSQFITNAFDIFSLGVIIAKIMIGTDCYCDFCDMPYRRRVIHVHTIWRTKLLGIWGPKSPQLKLYCKQVKACIEIASKCLKENRKERPTIEEIVNTLNATQTMEGEPDGRSRKRVNGASTARQQSGPSDAPNCTAPKRKKRDTDVLERKCIIQYGDRSLQFQDDVDRLLEDGSLDDNVESFLSQDDMDPRDSLGRCMDASKGFGFAEVGKAPASSTKVVCCHFSSDGKLLATGGHDKKVLLWSTEPVLLAKSSLEEHSCLITDVRFSPSMSRLATSSFDKTVRVWDADNPDYSLRTFTGHSASVMSLDFHPNKEDMICSCDSDGEVRSWSINNGSCLSCVMAFKGGATQMRFQPRKGKYLAVASDKSIFILDGETQHPCRSPLQGHNKIIQSLCWDSAGDYLASVSEDSVRIWSFATGDGEFMHELNCSGNKFQSCVFHPTYPHLLVIGCYESLELWDIREKNAMTFNNAHDGLIAALAASSTTGKIASVSHDRFVKLWK